MFELHVLPAEPVQQEPGHYLIYRPRAGIAFVGNRAMADLALSASRDELTADDLAGRACDFLDRIGFLESDPPVPIPPALEFRPATAVLLMTNDCQLRCTYCYAAAGSAPREELDPHMAHVVIDHVCDTAVQQGLDYFELSLHGGGEPTRAWGALKHCVDYARGRPLPAQITMTSNGVWSPGQLEWITENVDAATISVDGAPDTQNRQRPFESGQGSAATVLRNLAELDAREFPYAIRMTATPPWDHLAKDVQFLFESTQCQSIHVEPAFNTSRGGHPEPDEAAAQAFSQAFVEAFLVASSAGRQLAYSGASVNAVAATHCSAPYESLIVTTRGSLVTCYEVTSPSHPLAGISTIGRVAGGTLTIDDARRLTLLDKLAERRDRLCQGCWCATTCAGDCYARAFDSGERGHLSFGRRCQMNRDVTKGVLLALIATGAGVWRRGDWEAIA